MCDIIRKIKSKTPNQLLKRYYEPLTVPVDVVSLAENIGIQLTSVDFTKMEQTDLFKEKVKKKGNILGMVEIKGENVKISYSNILYDDGLHNDLSIEEKNEILRNRQRFTIAHEIAHCCLHMNNRDGGHIEYRIEQTDYDDPREREANIFAGELLIPTSVFKEIALLLSYRLPLRKLSRIFKVSKSVIKARIVYLMEINQLPEYTTIYD